jgi:hypothetical protein
MNNKLWENMGGIKMSKNRCPIDLGNAINIIHRRATGSPLTIMRYEELFDFFSEEPPSIAVKKDKKDKNNLFECILRIRVWRTKGKCISWSIYSEEREKFDSVIIRRVCWNLDKDTEFAKKRLKEKNKDLWKKRWKETIEIWPTIEICNMYISLTQSDDIIRLLHNFDMEIEGGFKLNKDDRQSEEWRELEIRRKFDWGQIHLIWGEERKNEYIEYKIKELVSKLDLMVNEIDEKIFEMTLHYTMDPEDYKNLLKGYE